MTVPDRRFRLLHRELVALALLAFLLTRLVAASNRDLRVQDAAAWYREGQQSLQAGRAAEAVHTLRRAVAIDPDARSYRLTLADALAARRRGARRYDRTRR